MNISPEQQAVIDAFASVAKEAATGGDGRAVRMVEFLTPRVVEVLAAAPKPEAQAAGLPWQYVSAGAHGIEDVPAHPPAVVGDGVPLRVFSAGRWTYDGTGQTFSHEDMDAAAFVVYRDHAALTPAATPGLHPATADLVARFSAALAEKLSAAERKYGYSDGWSSPEWMDECRQKLVEHVAKGDPRDVAAYCAFLWHHGESTAQKEGNGNAAG